MLRNWSHSLRRWTTRILWWSAGAVPDVVEVLSPQERIKYFSIGLGIFITAIGTALSMGYALRIVGINSAIAVLLALLWALMITTINRAFVTAIKVRGATGYSIRLIEIIPRIFLAICVAVVIAQPLQLMLFAGEINREFQMQNATAIRQINEQIAVLEADTTSLQRQLDSMSADVNEKLNSYLKEVDGSGRTRRLGSGPVSRIRLEVYKQADKEFKENRTQFHIQMRQNSDRVASLRSRRDQLVHDTTARPASFITRLEILARLRKETNGRRIEFLLIGILIVLEIMPIFLKLLAPADFYEYTVEHSGNDLALKQIRQLDELTEETTERMQRALTEALDRSELNPNREEVRSR